MFPKELCENAADPQTGAARNQESCGKVRRGPAVRSFQVRRGVAAAAEDGRVDCERTEWTPPPPRYSADTLVPLRIEAADIPMRVQAKAAGGR